MDSRLALLELLANHVPFDEKEARDLASMRTYARELGDPLSPDALPGHPVGYRAARHFTASALVIGPSSDHVCLVHHRKLGRWLQPGGHVEASDQADLVRTALREVREETGLEVELHATAPKPLDVDIHLIPARAAAPAHEHLDVRFLTVAASTVARFDPSESLGVRWFSWQDALREAGDEALVRLLEKGRRFRAGKG